MMMVLMVKVGLIGAVELRIGLKSDHMKQNCQGQWHQEVGGGSGLRKVMLAEEGKEGGTETPALVVIWSRIKKRGIRKGQEILESL